VVSDANRIVRGFLADGNLASDSATGAVRTPRALSPAPYEQANDTEDAPTKNSRSPVSRADRGTKEPGRKIRPHLNPPVKGGKYENGNTPGHT
jgi:hypothetical protein